MRLAVAFLAVGGLLTGCGGGGTRSTEKAACADLHSLGQNIGTDTIPQMTRQAAAFNTSAQDSGNANLPAVSFQLKTAMDAVTGPTDETHFVPLRTALHRSEALCVKLGYS